MKRLWIGIGFLAAILTVGIVLTVLFHHIHTPLSRDMRQASQLAMDGNWEKATALTRKARADWKQYRKLIAAVADHEPLEEMEHLLEQLEVYGAQKKTERFSALCVEVASLADAMLETQQITWWNFL